MTILYNYMFRPLLVIFRLSSRQLKVLPAHQETSKLDTSHQTLSCL